MATTCFGQSDAADHASGAAVAAADAPRASPGGPDAGPKEAVPQPQQAASAEPSAAAQAEERAAATATCAGEAPPASPGGPDAGPQPTRPEAAAQPQDSASPPPSGAAHGEQRAGSAGAASPSAASAAAAAIEEPELALEQMRLSIEDGLLMVLGPEGDPVPPHAFGAAAAARPDTPLTLPDGTTAPAFRVAAVLGAQLFGRLGAAEEGEGWILAMLREGEGPMPTPDEALRAEQAEARADALPSAPQDVAAAARAAADPAAAEPGVSIEPSGAGPRLALDREGPSDASAADLKLDVAADQPAADHAAADGPMSSWLDESLASDDPVGSNEGIESDEQIGSYEQIASGESLASEQVFRFDAPIGSRQSFGAAELVHSEEAIGSEPVLRPDESIGSDELFGTQEPSGADEFFQSDEPFGSEQTFRSDEPIGSYESFGAHEAFGSEATFRSDAPVRSGELVRPEQPAAAQPGQAREADVNPDSMVLVVMRGVPGGASLSTGIRDDDGSWSISPIDLATVTISLAGEGDGSGEAGGDERDLSITGIAFGEDGELVAISETVPLADYLAAPAPAEPAPQRPENSAPASPPCAAPGPRVVPLELDPQTLAGDAFDALVIRGVPSGARLSAGAYDPAIAGWVLRPQDLSALALLAPLDLRGDFRLTLMGIALRPGDAGAARILARLPVRLA